MIYSVLCKEVEILHDKPRNEKYFIAFVDADSDLAACMVAFRELATVHWGTRVTNPEELYNTFEYVEPVPAFNLTQTGLNDRTSTKRISVIEARENT